MKTFRLTIDKVGPIGFKKTELSPKTENSHPCNTHLWDIREPYLYKLFYVRFCEELIACMSSRSSCHLLQCNKHEDAASFLPWRGPIPGYRKPLHGLDKIVLLGKSTSFGTLTYSFGPLDPANGLSKPGPGVVSRNIWRREQSTGSGTLTHLLPMV